MSLHDPISDFLTRMRNANSRRHKFVDVRLSKQSINIAKLLEAQGFVEHILLDKEKQKMRVFLKYVKGKNPVLNGLKRNSSPGLRRYIGYREIPKVLGGMGIVVLSTTQGVIDGETARQQKLGGELLCTIW
jgi:small subunit ribosomal protein S8